jgi:catechol 2,3-dioxygenase-like lactoylglutathione lyase family enzyme
MKVEGLAFVGTRADRFQEMRRFYDETLGLEMTVDDPGLSIWRLPDGGLVEIFSEDEPEHLFMTTGPVAGFRVDDVTKARAELEEQGIEFFGPTVRVEAQGRGYAFFRAPDGNVYEITGPESAPA